MFLFIRNFKQSKFGKLWGNYFIYTSYENLNKSFEDFEKDGMERVYLYM